MARTLPLAQSFWPLCAQSAVVHARYLTARSVPQVTARVGGYLRRVPGRCASSARLLDLDAGPSLFELGLDLGRLLLGDRLLDRLGGAVDQVLGLLETEAGQLADRLDDVDLCVAGA